MFVISFFNLFLQALFSTRVASRGGISWYESCSGTIEDDGLDRT